MAKAMSNTVFNRKPPVKRAGVHSKNKPPIKAYRGQGR